MIEREADSTAEKTNPPHSEAGEIQLVKSEALTKIPEQLALDGANLRDLEDLQRGLERTILSSGLQVMADRYGADALLKAMDGSFNMGEVVDRLVESRQDRKALMEAIRTEPVDELADKFNDVAGGVATTSGEHGLLGLKRKYGVQGLEKHKDTIDAHGLLSTALPKLLAENPAIAESFKSTGDTIKLLTDIRAVYEDKYEQHVDGLALSLENIEAEIGAGESEIAELQKASSEIYEAEIKSLEARLALATNDSMRAMLTGMLDEKAVIVAKAHADLATSFDDVRTAALAQPGVRYVYGAKPLPLSKPEPTWARSEPVLH